MEEAKGSEGSEVEEPEQMYTTANNTALVQGSGSKTGFNIKVPPPSGTALFGGRTKPNAGAQARHGGVAGSQGPGNRPNFGGQ